MVILSLADSGVNGRDGPYFGQCPSTIIPSGAKNPVTRVPTLTENKETLPSTVVEVRVTAVGSQRQGDNSTSR